MMFNIERKMREVALFLPMLFDAQHGRIEPTNGMHGGMVRLRR